MKIIPENRTTRWLLIAIISYIAIFFSFSFFKYIYYAYNGLDLAIFNQVFYHSSLGDFFGSTIHPPSYLGDHFIPLIIILTPLYALWRSPLILLLLQTIILSLAAIPLFLIAKKLINLKLALLLAIAFLLNPFLQNINLFEWHELSFLPFLFLFTFYFYQQKRFKWFLIFFILCLFIREDISFIMFMFAPFALIEKRRIKWVMTPLFCGVLYFLAALLTIQYFAPIGEYKFLAYYAWLGHSPGEILLTLITRPFTVIKHLFKIGNLEMIFGFLLGFWFLPVLKPKYLLFCLPVFLQFALGSAGGSNLILNTHYSALFFPGLILAAVYSLKLLSDQTVPKYTFIAKLKNKLLKEKFLSLIILIIIIIYACLVFGPLYHGLKEINQGIFNNQTRVIKDYLTKKISKEAKIATTSNFLTNISSRQNISLLSYAYIGQKQFGQGKYQLPADTEYLLIDGEDLMEYDTAYKNHPLLASYYPEASSQFRRQLQELQLEPTQIIDKYSLWQKSGTNWQNIYQINPPKEEVNNLAGQKTDINEAIKFLGYRIKTQVKPELQLTAARFVPIDFYWQVVEKIPVNYHLLLEMTDKENKIIFSNLYPIAGGIYPTSDWQAGEIVAAKYNFLWPKIKESANAKLLISLVEITGGIEVNGIRSTVLKIDEQKILGKKIELGNYNNFVK